MRETIKIENPFEKICDLHVHSTFSDGTLTPEQILRLAKETGLSAVALTDHNTVDGLEDFLIASKNYNVEAVLGVEISSIYEQTELHVLALFISKEKFCLVKDFLQTANRRKEESNKLLAQRLVDGGYDIDYDKIKEQAGGFINRVHFAKALIEKGYIKSVNEGFETLLSENGGFYVPPKRLTTFEVLDFIKSIGAVSVLAHPLLDLSKEELVKLIPQAKEHGLKAIEGRYSKYSLEEQEFSEKIAKEFDLLLSGGSDFHGENKPDIKLGKGMGNLKIPYDYVIKMNRSKK